MSAYLDQTAASRPAECPIPKPNRKLALGLALIGLSVAIRASAIVVALTWRDAATAAFCAGAYLVGKVVFYAGLAVGGPAAAKRIPWLRRRLEKRRVQTGSR